MDLCPLTKRANNGLLQQHSTAANMAIRLRDMEATLTLSTPAVPNWRYSNGPAPYQQWRMQDLQTGAKVERRRREYRGAEGVGRGENVFDFRSKNVDF